MQLSSKCWTGSGIQPVSYLTDIRSSFPGSKTARVWSWPLSHPVPGLRIRRAMPPLLLCHHGTYKGLYHSHLAVRKWIRQMESNVVTNEKIHITPTNNSCEDKWQCSNWTAPYRNTVFQNNKIFVLFYILFVVCRSVYCLCVDVYCTTATRWLPNRS